MSNDQSLLERIEMPSIPESAMKKIAILEEEFGRAEVEQCKSFSISWLSFFYGIGAMQYLVKSIPFYH